MKIINKCRPRTLAVIFSLWIAAMIGLSISIYVDLRREVPEVEVFYIKNPNVEVFSIREPEVTVKSIPSTRYTKIVPERQAQDEIRVISTDVIFMSERERTCLIRNVFYESGAEPYLGKIAVAQVTWNRLKTGKWGNDICKVVYAPGQFSWTTDGRKRSAPVDTTRWVDSIQAVDDFINGTRIVRLDRGLFFHASHVRPNWNGFADRIKQIGNHVFYAQK